MKKKTKKLIPKQDYKKFFEGYAKEMFEGKYPGKIVAVTDNFDEALGYLEQLGKK